MKYSKLKLHVKALQSKEFYEFSLSLSLLGLWASSTQKWISNNSAFWNERSRVISNPMKIVYFNQDKEGQSYARTTWDTEFSKARCGLARSRTSNLNRCTLSHPNSWTRITPGYKRCFRDQTHPLNRPATTQTRKNHLPPSTLKSTVYSRCLGAATLLLQTIINMLKISMWQQLPSLTWSNWKPHRSRIARKDEENWKDLFKIG